MSFRISSSATSTSSSSNARAGYWTQRWITTKSHQQTSPSCLKMINSSRVLQRSTQPHESHIATSILNIGALDNVLIKRFYNQQKGQIRPTSSANQDASSSAPLPNKDAPLTRRLGQPQPLTHPHLLKENESK